MNTHSQADPPCTEADRAAIVSAADSIVTDALRYRCLRTSLNGRGVSWMPELTDPRNSMLTYTPEGLDEAIDAALLQLTEGA